MILKKKHSNKLKIKQKKSQKKTIKILKLHVVFMIDWKCRGNEIKH